MEKTREILKARNLKKYYGSGESLVKAVDNISLSVNEGEFVAIVGTSGSGKSTLLHLLGGLDYADEGEVIIDGMDVLKMKDEEQTVFRRRKIGFIFQNYNLLAASNVYKNVTLPIRLDGNRPDEAYIDMILKLLGLEDKKGRRPNQLSGGQQQRVAIARALAGKPAIILADEPTGNLDSKTSAEVMGLLHRSGREFHQTILMITHNEEIAQMADRIIHLEDGRVVGGEAHGTK
ncbi:MAG: ABC transporter ATP-binding protein [Lachnospiraceae bacterium]|nr:ABC transporter ATP-binding protein [Lachnospiraceae bacterium]MDE6962983.1 ABC transporter ATP-binding protein [Lachnospiraceae bacterium]